VSRDVGIYGLLRRVRSTTRSIAFHAMAPGFGNQISIGVVLTSTVTSAPVSTFSKIEL
jgi:hypothetical protein